MKDIRKYLVGLMLFMGLPILIHAANTCAKSDIECYQSGPSQNLSTMYRVDASGNATFAGTLTTQGSGTQTIGGTLFQGVSGVVISTLPTAGNSIGTYYQVNLATGTLSPAVEGSVLVSTYSSTGGVTVFVSTGIGHVNVVGIAQAAASTGTVVNMYSSGFVLALGSGTIAVGDLLQSSFTTTGVGGGGYLATTTTPANGAIVAVALGANTFGSANLIKVKLIH